MSEGGAVVVASVALITDAAIRVVFIVAIFYVIGKAIGAIKGRKEEGK